MNNIVSVPHPNTQEDTDCGDCTTFLAAYNLYTSAVATDLAKTPYS